MNMKAILTAGALAVSMPFAASAAQLIVDGGEYSISEGSEFFGNVGGASNGGGAGSWSVLFDATTDPLTAGASATIGNIVLSQFTDLTMEWIAESDGFVLASAAVTTDDFSLTTVFTEVGVLAGDDNPQFLVLSWSDSSEGAGFDVEVAAVPLPAGVLLMGTALAGFGVMRRRKAQK